MKILFLRDTAGLLLHRKEHILYFLLMIFFFSLYMPGITWLYNACMWLLFVYSFFFNTVSEKWKLVKRRKELIIIMLFFLLNFLSGLLSANVKEGISLTGIRISLLVMPLAIGTLHLKKNLKERIILAFAISTTCAAFVSLVGGIWRCIENHDPSLLYNDNLSNLLNLQSIYFALLINLAVFSFIYLLINNSELINTKALVPVLLLLFAVHFLLASRIAFIILYGAILIFSVVRIILKKKVTQGILIITGLLLFGFVMMNLFPKTINRFKELAYTKFDFRSSAKESHYNAQVTADQWNGANVRIAVWECTWAVIKNNMLVGTGLGDKMDVLKEQYAKKGFSFGIKTNRNVHNNYLDVWMSLGLAGLLVFLLGFIILPLFSCSKTGDWYGAAVIMCFTVSMFTETYMDRTIGNTLLAFFLALITASKKPGEPAGY